MQCMCYFCSISSVSLLQLHRSMIFKWRNGYEHSSHLLSYVNQKTPPFNTSRTAEFWIIYDRKVAIPSAYLLNIMIKKKLFLTSCHIKLPLFQILQMAEDSLGRSISTLSYTKMTMIDLYTFYAGNRRCCRCHWPISDVWTGLLSALMIVGSEKRPRNIVQMVFWKKDVLWQ